MHKKSKYIPSIFGLETFHVQSSLAPRGNVTDYNTKDMDTEFPISWKIGNASLYFHIYQREQVFFLQKK